MADGCQEAAWAHTVALAIGFGKFIHGQGPGILDLVPERYRRPGREPTPEEDDAVAALGFMGLEAGLRAVSKEWKRRV